jgi:hypothetical protein
MGTNPQRIERNVEASGQFPTLLNPESFFFLVVLDD